MEEQKNGLMSTKGVQMVDTGWVDVTPTAVTSNKLASVGSRWAQYRVYSNGILLFRGSCRRNSGTYSPGENPCSIPAHLAKAMGANSFFPVAPGNPTAIIGLQTNGFIFFSVQPGWGDVFLDGIYASVY